MVPMISHAARRMTWPVAALIFLSGCTGFSDYVHNGFKVGPNYCPPAAPVAEHWIDQSDMRLRSAADDLSCWWAVFNDPDLNGLIAGAYHQNLTLREAAFRIMEARAQSNIAAGNLFPQSQAATASYQHEMIPNLGIGPLQIPQTSFDLWNVGLNLSWELDFWGRMRRAVEAADDQLGASVENYDDVLVTLLADVAANYVQMRVSQEQIVLAEKNVELQKGILSETEKQFEAGTRSKLDARQAESTLKETESQIPLLRRMERHAADRLCILLGMPPMDMQTRLCVRPIPTAPVSVCVGIPADLVRRRPDVRRAEWQLAAQAQQIGIAMADFYPSVAINGNLGYESQNLSHLFTGAEFTGAVGPALNWKILNYGRIVNNVRYQDARYRELLTHYLGQVLQAGDEVEDALVDFLQSQERVTTLEVAAKASEDAVTLVTYQYHTGTRDFTNVAVISQNLVRQQDLLAQARGDIVQSLIRVYKALGGGWQIRLQGDGVGAENPPGSAEELPPSAQPSAAPPEALPAAPPVPTPSLPAPAKG